MGWCETHVGDYVFGLAKNSHLKTAVTAELCEAACVFKSFRCQIRESWSRVRCVICKAEHLAKVENPRFVVTSLSPERPRKTCGVWC